MQGLAALAGGVGVNIGVGVNTGVEVFAGVDVITGGVLVLQAEKKRIITIPILSSQAFFINPSLWQLNRDKALLRAFCESDNAAKSEYAVESPCVLQWDYDRGMIPIPQESITLY